MALAVVLIVVINAGVTYGIVQWASPSGTQGPQGVQGVQGIPGPVATADVNTALCTAVLQGGIGPGGVYEYGQLVAKYCP